MYWSLINDTDSGLEATRVLWEADLGTELDKDEWAKLYTQTFSYTISTKLRYFQYRVLNRIVTTNVKRSKWDNTVSPKCFFCNDKAETMLHIFYECKVTTKIREALERWLKYFYNITIQLNPEVILLNRYEGKYKKLINMYILVMKQHIYASKCLQKIPTFMGLTQKINNWYNIERNAAFLKGNMTKFQKKWKHYENHM